MKITTFNPMILTKKPEEAIALASRILIEHFNILTDLTSIADVSGMMIEKTEDPKVKALDNTSLKNRTMYYNGRTKAKSNKSNKFWIQKQNIFPENMLEKKKEQEDTIKYLVESLNGEQKPYKNKENASK